MANINKLITLTDKSDAGPYFDVFYSTDCISYTIAVDGNNVYLPNVGSTVVVTVPEETVCMKLTSEGTCTNSVISGSFTTTTTTTSSTTTTTSTTTASPNKLLIVSSSNNTSTNFNNVLNNTQLNFVTSGTNLRLQNMPIGENSTSSLQSLSGNQTVNSSFNVQSVSYGSMAYTQSLYGDTTLLSTYTGVISEPTTGLTFGHGVRNTNAYTTWSIELELNPSPTTTTTTTTTLACTEWDLFCPSNASGQCTFEVDCCDGSTVTYNMSPDTNAIACVIAGGSVTKTSVSGVATPQGTSCSSSCGDVVPTTTTTSTTSTTTTQSPCYECGDGFVYYTTSSNDFEVYPDRDICSTSDTCFDLYWDVSERPNRFSVYDSTGLIWTSGWVGQATYPGPWGSSLNTPTSGNSGTQQFGSTSGRYVRVEAGNGDPLNPTTDAANWRMLCAVCPEDCKEYELECRSGAVGNFCSFEWTDCSGSAQSAILPADSNEFICAVTNTVSKTSVSGQFYEIGLCNPITTTTTTSPTTTTTSTTTQANCITSFGAGMTPCFGGTLDDYMEAEVILQNNVSVDTTFTIRVTYVPGSAIANCETEPTLSIDIDVTVPAGQNEYFVTCGEAPFIDEGGATICGFELIDPPFPIC